MASSAVRFQACNGVSGIFLHYSTSLFGFGNADHSWATELKGTEIMVAEDVNDGKACLLKQQLHFAALEQIQVCGNGRAQHRPALGVLLIEVCQFEHMLISSGGGTDEVGKHAAIVAFPRALVKYMPTQIFQIVCISIANVDNK